jgi:hypothetical protein
MRKTAATAKEAAAVFVRSGQGAGQPFRDGIVYSTRDNIIQPSTTSRDSADQACAALELFRADFATRYARGYNHGRFKTYNRDECGREGCTGRRHSTRPICVLFQTMIPRPLNPRRK